MWRRLTLIASAAAVVIVGASPASGEGGWADPDSDGPVIDQGIDLDPDSSDGDGGADGDNSDTNDGDSGGEPNGDNGFAPECIVQNSPEFFCAGELEDGPEETDESGESGDSSAPVNPTDLGGQVLDHMLLPSPEVSISPGPPNTTYVNLWTWFWVPKSQWVTHSESVSLRGTTVTVTIEPVYSRWQTGEGTVTTCDGPGSPWIPGSPDSSACGHRYETVGTKTVSASIGWHARWSCSGVCIADGGDFGIIESDPSSAQLEVRQRQSLVIG